MTNAAYPRGRTQECQEWLRSVEAKRCRLVHYVGPTPFAKDVPVGQLLSEIEGIVGEGLFVDWRGDAGTIFLRVWEPGTAEPPWPSVLAEEPLA